MPMTPSMRADNHYTFLCPTTARQERYIACMFRRHKHWRGERIEADCATCMNAGKCPALKMLDREWREERSIYFDAVPNRVRKLPDDILKHIEMKMVCTIHAFGTGIDRATLERLMGQKLRDAVFEGIEHNTIVPDLGGDPGLRADEPGSVSRAAAHAVETRAERQKLAVMAARAAASRSKPVKAVKESSDSLADAVAIVSTDMASAINQAIRNQEGV